MVFLKQRLYQLRQRMYTVHKTGAAVVVWEAEDLPPSGNAPSVVPPVDVQLEEVS